MKKFLLTSACALMLATAAGGAEAHQSGNMMGQSGNMMGQPGTMMSQSGSGMMTGQDDDDQARPMPGYGRRGNMPWGYHGHMGPGMMYGRGGGYGMGPGMMGGRGYGMGPGMMGSGMMGTGMMGPQMMILMMDTNGDGKLSLDEFQAIHGRMFKYLDKNGDGQLTPDEIRKNWQDDDDGDEGGDAK